MHFRVILRGGLPPGLTNDSRIQGRYLPPSEESVRYRFLSSRFAIQLSETDDPAAASATWVASPATGVGILGIRGDLSTDKNASDAFFRAASYEAFESSCATSLA
jgi:hypothetical protein